MCGINGIVALKGISGRIDSAELIRTRDYMVSRGPDGAGEWVSADGRAGLAHRRLSIIDLSSAGGQPMSWDAGRYQIVFNGEIYNYQVLREELVREGVRFNSTSDTEVILALYARRGAGAVKRLRGMYAFGIWDDLEKSLFVARDPYGIKPLYFSNDGSYFRFCSQVKGLEAGNAISLDVDASGLVGFLLWGAVPEPYTIRKSIRALPPGHCLMIQGGRAGVPNSFYNFSDDDSICEPCGMEEALTDSIRAHLVSDVPVAVYLSAGLDSSLLTALACRVLEKPPITFTLTFEDFEGTGLDEGPIAREVAKSLGTEHIERKIERDEFRDLWSHVIQSMDQPTIDGFNTYLVSRAAHEQGLKVALSGLGGDELFGGYPTFKDVPRWARLARVGKSIPGAKRIWSPLARKFCGNKPKLAGFLDYGGSLPGAYYLRRGLFLPDELPAIIGEDLAREGLSAYEPVEDAGKCLSAFDFSCLGTREAAAQWEAVHLMESTQYMLNQLLHDSDWASMAHSVELRVPLVDIWLRHSTVAADFEPARSRGKAALVRQVAPELPDSLWNRPKSGFFIPVLELLLGKEHKNEGLGKNSRLIAIKVLSSFGIQM